MPVCKEENWPSWKFSLMTNRASQGLAFAILSPIPSVAGNHFQAGGFGVVFHGNHFRDNGDGDLLRGIGSYIQADGTMNPFDRFRSHTLFSQVVQHALRLVAAADGAKIAKRLLTAIFQDVLVVSVAVG